MSNQSNVAPVKHDGPIVNVAAVTPGNTDLDCRWIGTSAACTVDVTNWDGSTTAGVPLIAGWTPMSVRRITATSGTVFAGW